MEGENSKMSEFIKKVKKALPDSFSADFSILRIYLEQCNYT
jgi:hypothetical protein